jgi:predicted TIM-barrel fold metal-dependent hydrolase
MYNGVKVLDMHGHVSSPEATSNYLMLMMAANTAFPSPLPTGGVPAAGGRTSAGLSPDDFMKASQRHVDYMDERTIDVQIIGPRPFRVMGFMEDHLIPNWARFVNDCIKIQCDQFPDRFLGAAQLPQNSNAPDTKHVLPELERCVNELGFIATYASPDPGGRRTTPGMWEAYWFPLYEKCQELKLPIIVHGTNALDKRFRVVPHNYQLGFYTEQYLATQFLGHSDVFQRYPELKIIICHCGGGLDRFHKSDPHLPQKDLSKNLYFDTCAYDPIFLEAAIRQRGARRMLFGSEAPGSGRHTNPETGLSGDNLVPVIGGYSFISEADKLYIFNDGPREVFPAFTRLDPAGSKAAAATA